MRDVHNATSLARSLRVALAAEGVNITAAQSVRVIAEVFGVADKVRFGSTTFRPVPGEPGGAPTKRHRPVDDCTLTRLSAELGRTLRRAVGHAEQRNHEYATLEHLLLALIEDTNARGLMAVFDVDLDALREKLQGFIVHDMAVLVIDDGRQPKPTAAFQRIVHNASLRARQMSREVATGGDLLVALLDEKKSHAVWLLRRQGLVKRDILEFIRNGTVGEKDFA